MANDLLAQITKRVVDGEPDAVVELTTQALSEGLEPMSIINQGLVPGMDIAGEKFAKGEFFLPHLLFAAKGMQQAMELLDPELRAREQAREMVGTVVIGTVHGDIHEIGKSLVAMMLSVNGFEVHDLGVDVPVETFVQKVKETGAELLGMSALLTTTMVVQREVIDALVEAGIRKQVKVMVGGAPVSTAWAEEIHADAYAADAISAVHKARQMLG
jgi:corrinoid protein of di/trimethylamine methyltransferase